MWWPIIDSLVQHFRAELAGVDTKAGLEEDDEAMTCPAIRIRRGGERDKNILTSGKETVTLWLDAWVENHDIDPGVAYKLLYELEKPMLMSLERWMQSASKLLKMRMSFEPLEIIPDGDQFRPRVGSRTILKITWNK